MSRGCSRFLIATAAALCALPAHADVFKCVGPDGHVTYTNDKSVGGRVLVDASIGVKVPQGMGFLTGFAIEASATNLFDKDYVSTIGSNGFGNSGDNQTLLIGAPQQFFVTLRRGF